MSAKNEQGSMDVKQKNGKLPPPLKPNSSPNHSDSVLNAPLHKHSSESSTPKSLPSSIHAGMCNSTNPIAAELTTAFIDTLSRSGSTDLQKAGVTAGQRFCVEASSWKTMADKGGEDVPRVKLESSHEAALKSVGLDTLKKFAAGQDRASVHGAARPKDGKGGWVRESGEIGGKEPKA
jgi:hypothetical protein